MQTQKLYATGTVSANAAAQITIPRNTRIRGAQWSLLVDTGSDNSVARCECSKASASEISVNAAQQGFTEIGSFNNLQTSGMVMNSANLFVPLDIAVIQGQLIYLNTYVSGTLTYYCTCILMFD